MPDHPIPCSLIKRRTFLLGLGATVVTAACSSKNITVVAPTTSTTPTTAAGGTPRKAPSAGTTTLPPGSLGGRDDRTLVILELGGGNDGLNMVVPYANNAYYDLRPNIGIRNPLDLDGSIGLHPNLTAIADQFTVGNAAVIEGVGYPNPNLSHFESMETWWSGTSKPDSATGWIGRYLDGTVGYDDLLAGITVGPGPSRAMLGSGSFVVNIQDAGGLSSQVPWWIDEEGDFFATWGGFAPVDVPLGELTPVERAIGATVRANDRLSTGLVPLQNAVANGEVPEDEQWSIQGQMRLAANLITAGIAPRVIYLHGMGDFDTHENLVSRQAALMTDINNGVKTFYEIIDAAGMSDEVIFMTTSEFGRRADENGEGTDHGTASSQFIIGSSVTGGRYGKQPSLTKLDPDGNLIHTVDFRSTFATVLDDWLGVDHSAVLEGSFETLPFLQT
ncbi:Protein of unknown function (DUF1501) [hydrothermal vent metagenome]|uniref:DUF1501 domain-containing protein n=1 Tax=hydrothermal vent metagenome TaxID=652676 RepID=A0A3B0SDL4_9ZZZZ